jgi:hypothetical protein
VVTRSYQVVDVTDPSVTLTTPSTDAMYEVGESVAADFSCSDAGSGIDSCVGTVADGSPIDTSTVGSNSFTVTGTDNAGNDTVVTRSYTVVRHQPDGHVRRSTDAAFVGDGVLNATGAGQTRTTGVTRSHAATFVVRIQNDGSGVDSTVVRGQRTVGRFRVQYLRGNLDVTGQVVAGTYRVADLAPGATVNLRVVISARANGARGSVVTATVTLRSEAVASAVDAVRAKVRLTG